MQTGRWWRLAAVAAALGALPLAASAQEEAEAPAAEEPLVVKSGDVMLKRRVVPEFPDAARQLYQGKGAKKGKRRKKAPAEPIVCPAQVTVDPLGSPTSVELEGCPEVFHDSVRKALAGWRWYPYKVDGQKVAVSFELQFRFVP